MQVVICPDTDDAIGRVAAAVVDAVARDPATVLGLATGSTMDGVYACTAALAARRRVAFDRVRCFHLDEYLGLAADHPQAYAAYLRARVLVPLGIPAGLACFLDGTARDPEAEAARYEAAIAAAGGIDLQLLGIGTNGHIGFNEPGTPFDSRTGVAALTSQTRQANSRHFDRPRDVPQAALTMGIGTILKARRCLLLALGPAKAAAVAAMVEGPVDPACPASALRTHPAATAVLDRAAAGALRPGAAELVPAETMADQPLAATARSVP